MKMLPLRILFYNHVRRHIINRRRRREWLAAGNPERWFLESKPITQIDLDFAAMMARDICTLPLRIYKPAPQPAPQQDQRGEP